MVICRGENMFSSTNVTDIKDTLKNKSSVFHNHKKTYKKNLKSKEKAEKEKMMQKQWKNYILENSETQLKIWAKETKNNRK